MVVLKEMPVKHNFISGLLGERGDINSISKILKRARSYFNKSLRTLPAYDPKKQGSLVEFVVPGGLIEIERYWLQEPYTFASILEDRSTKYYKLIEPGLTKYEKKLLEIIYEDFQDILVLNFTTSRFEKDTLLVDKTLYLLERYRAKFRHPLFKR